MFPTALPRPEEPIVTPPAGPFLIVGLGNHGRSYRHNRHNIGFQLADRVATRLEASFTRVQFRALVTDARTQGMRLILAKPQTYMNQSGQAVAPLVNFYKLSLDRLLVAYDELDLPLGTLRLRPGGGSGGHNGMRSVIASLGADEFPRLRLGIGRPPGQMDPADYVLQDFTQGEAEAVQDMLARAVETVFAWLTAGIQQAMTEFNRE